MQRNLRQLLLLLLLLPLLEPLQAYVHPKSSTALQLPVVAVPAETQHCYSKCLPTAVAPVAADIATDPVHAAPRAVISPPAASAKSAHRRLNQGCASWIERGVPTADATLVVAASVDAMH